MTVENEADASGEKIQNAICRKVFAPLVILGAFLFASTAPSLSSYRNDVQHVHGIFRDAVNQTPTAEVKFTIESDALDAEEEETWDVVRGRDGADGSGNDASTSQPTVSVDGTSMDTTGAETKYQLNVKRPWLIMHIGPSKTATTSIQCGLEEHSQQLRDLDNYYYMGIPCPGKGRNSKMPNNETAIQFFQFAGYMNWLQSKDESILDEVLPRLEDHRKQGHNVIISSEHFIENLNTQAHDRWRKVKEMLQGFQVRAVVVNRNLVDWFPSYYFQRSVGEGKPPPSMHQFLLQSLKAWEQGENHTRPGFRSHQDHRRAIQMWSSYFDLDVMDLYAPAYGGDVVENLICDFIPNANGTCSMLNQRRQGQKELTTNTSQHGSEEGTETILHARKSKSVHEARILGFALQSQDFITTSGLKEREAKNELRVKKHQFEMNAARILMEHGIVSESSPYLDCLPSRMESRLKSVATSFTEAYHHQQYGRDMSKNELEVALAKQDELFEKNRAKYCDLNLKMLFENGTIREHLLHGMSPKLELANTTKTSGAVEGVPSVAAVNKSNHTKPWLVVHMGPPKTGTTSIQCGLHKNFEALMDLDNYYYLGIDCLGERGMPRNEMSFKLVKVTGNINGAKEGHFDSYVFQFLAALEKHRKQGHNVIVSSEHFVSLLSDGAKAQNNWSIFTKMLQGFQMKAVLVQRNVVDWFPSNYYQKHLLAKSPPSFRSYLLESLHYWEQGTNSTPSTFKKHVDQRRALKMISSYFDVDVMEFYSDQYNGALFHRFVCQHVPNAAGTCNLLDTKVHEAEVSAAAQNTTSSTAIHTRKSKSLHDARIVFFAETTHKYPNASEMTDKDFGKARGMKRALINKVLDQYDVLVEGSNFLDCLPMDVEARFKAASTRVMQAYHKQQHGMDMNERELQVALASQDELFEKNRMKYCDVNLDRLFSNATIRELLLKDMVPKSNGR